MVTLQMITQGGWDKIDEELTRLLKVERPQVVQNVADAAAEGDRSENAEYIYGKKRLREIDRRLKYLQRRLEQLRVQGPPESDERVQFLSFVVLENIDTEEEHRYLIVGPDEGEPERGRISYLSPLGKALMGKREGEYAEFRTSTGPKSYEIMEIRLSATQ